jgi:hypothetical protein
MIEPQNDKLPGQIAYAAWRITPCLTKAKNSRWQHVYPNKP